MSFGKEKKLRYVSTRGSAPVLEFEDVVLAGLAVDGGLYVPEEYPYFSSRQIEAMRGLNYVDLAYQVLEPFVDGAINPDALQSLINNSYKNFAHPEIAPIKKLDENVFILELFHGPTLAFKDFALQVLARLFDYILLKRRQRITIVAATSGDTGSAAIEACLRREAIEIFILHPKGRVSDIQRRQMTTVKEDNVHNIAIEGTFDDCQELVKQMFNDSTFRAEQNLSAVNSINWARIMVQVVYYFFSSLKLGAPGRGIAYSVPTGNFGDIFAGYVATKMGLPIEKLIIATNTNDILSRFMIKGEMQIKEVIPTLSPAMDIQVSSNFERLLFDLYEGDGQMVKQKMDKFKKSGKMAVTSGVLKKVKKIFESCSLNDDGIKNQILETYEATGLIVDPHTATGVHAAASRSIENVPIVALSTAHPAKFPDAVKDAIKIKPQLPNHLSDLLNRTEFFEVLPNNIEVVKSYIRKTAFK